MGTRWGLRLRAWRRGFPEASSLDRRSRTLLVPNELRAACEKPSHTENSEKSLEVTSNLSIYSSPWYRLRCVSQGESHLSVTKIGQFYTRISSAPHGVSLQDEHSCGGSVWTADHSGCRTGLHPQTAKGRLGDGVICDEPHHGWAGLHRPVGWWTPGEQLCSRQLWEERNPRAGSLCVWNRPLALGSSSHQLTLLRRCHCTKLINS